MVTEHYSPFSTANMEKSTVWWMTITLKWPSKEPCLSSEPTDLKVFDIRNVQYSNLGLHLLKAQKIDKYWSQSFWIVPGSARMPWLEKEINPVSTQHARYWQGHNILICHSPDQMNESSALDTTELWGPLAQWATYCVLFSREIPMVWAGPLATRQAPQFSYHVITIKIQKATLALHFSNIPRYQQFSGQKGSSSVFVIECQSRQPAPRIAFLPIGFSSNVN